MNDRCKCCNGKVYPEDMNSNSYNRCKDNCIGSQLAIALAIEDGPLDRLEGVMNEINKSLSFLADEYAKERVSRI